MRNRRGGIASIIITIVVVFIVLSAIPMLKSLSNSNTSAANKGNNMFTTFVNDTEKYVDSNSSGTTTAPYK